MVGLKMEGIVKWRGNRRENCIAYFKPALSWQYKIRIPLLIQLQNVAWYYDGATVSNTKG